MKIIQWHKLWYHFPVVTQSYSGEQAVSFKKVSLQESLLSGYSHTLINIQLIWYWAPVSRLCVFEMIIDYIKEKLLEHETYGTVASGNDQLNERMNYSTSSQFGLDIIYTQ